jgi:hypothetical protein
MTTVVRGRLARLSLTTVGAYSDSCMWNQPATFLNRITPAQSPTRILRSSAIPQDGNCRPNYAKKCRANRALSAARFYEAELHRQKGELLFRTYGEGSGSIDSTSSRSCEIESCFLKAISIARRQQAKWFELRASMSLARLWQRQGEKAKAHAMLTESYNWFTEGLNTVDLKDAQMLLKELNGSKGGIVDAGDN